MSINFRFNSFQMYRDACVINLIYCHIDKCITIKLYTLINANTLFRGMMDPGLKQLAT